VIVLGDLNDEPPAATTQILLGPPGSEIGTPGFDHDDQGDACRLWNLAPLIPEQHRFRRRFRGRGELIDHLLVSHALVNQVEQADTGPGEPPTITEDPTDRRDQRASDHAPVWRASTWADCGKPVPTPATTASTSPEAEPPLPSS